MKITVTAPSGLEGVVKRELYNLTGLDAPSVNGKITIDGDIKTVALLNLKMRTASRVHIYIGGFKANDFDALYNGILTLDFESYLTKNSKISITASSFESKLASVQAIKSVTKKAVCERLQNFYKTKITELGFEHKIEVVLRHDFVSIYLNTSGESLHKRGYRDRQSEAPIKETVASSILALSVWNKSKTLVDPFCGSGTFVIEAGMIAKNVAPGLLRDFDFLHFDKFNTDFYAEMLSKAKSEIVNDTGFKIYGYDIDESVIKIARKNAKNAGVSNIVSFEVQNATEFTSKEEFGVIVTNPPYGERLLDRQAIVSLYKKFGVAFKNLSNWSAYVITPVTDFERLFGVKATKKRKIYNGKIECTLYSVMGKKPQKNF